MTLNTAEISWEKIYIYMGAKNGYLSLLNSYIVVKKHIIMTRGKLIKENHNIV